MALSTRTVAMDILLLKDDPYFGELTEAQQVQLLSASTQEFARLAKAADRADYHETTFADALNLQANPERAGSGVASIDGTAIEFSTPLPDADYVLMLPTGVDYLHPDTGADSRTTEGFTAYAAADGVAFMYIAKEPI